MEVQSESQNKLAQISTDFERGDSLIVKGNFYQIYTHKITRNEFVCICRVHFSKINTADLYLIQNLKSNRGMLINKIIQLR